jgi:predicted metal-dependent hydrolase
MSESMRSKPSAKKGRKAGLVLALSYRVREHPLAKHVRLKLSWHGALEIVVPRGYNRRRIPGVIAEKYHWLSSMQRRLESEMSTLPPDLTVDRPTRIHLRALRRSYRVSYYQDFRPEIRIFEDGERLNIRGAVADTALLAEALRKWLKDKATLELLPRLERAGVKYGFNYRKAMVRGQRTRWGSCSARGTISLNYKLLFVPRQLLEYLFVHELAHTRELNHSARYWALVCSRLADYSRLDKSLRDAWRFVPLWAGA